MEELMQVGFIGLGQMGRPMAERLLCPEISLHVFDPDAAAMDRLTSLGAIGHPDPASVAGAASLVLSCLPSPAVSEAVALGPDGIVGGQAVRTYVEMSTIGRRTVGRIADGLAERGIGLLDAPISGGPPGAMDRHARHHGVRRRTTTCAGPSLRCGASDGRSIASASAPGSVRR